MLCNGGTGVVSSITGSPTQYAGGGGGGGSSINTPNTFGLGEWCWQWFLGATSALSGKNAFSAYANTGGGGGGGGSASASYLTAGGAGGSGIVVIRYPSYLSQATSTTGSPTYYQSLGYNVYVFKASGTITF